MKHFLIILKILLFPYICCAQNVISSQLSSTLELSRDNELLPITIQLIDNFDIDNLEYEFIQNNISIKKRASMICDTMQKVASNTQYNVINIIKNNNEKYQNLKPTWIINTIFLDANKNLIQLLSNHENIGLIDLQHTVPDIIEYYDSNQVQIIEDGTEPGIEAINVRPLWELGYTGKNKIVFNYDTGVWPNHPAFKNRFLGNSYAMSQCWDGYFSPVPNGHVSDHGTHTLGTMSGLVEETNDTIGIAFKSYWMANDFVTSSVETLPPIEDMITSFEWALNPDGDISTSYDVPDVINNSWRWYNEMDTFQCSGYAVALMNVIEAAGIANIFSAGNNGPDNEGVRSPQRINSNLVNTFSVGSVNANGDDLVISTFSCRGPTQCPGEGSLALYPEVVAPGQNIRSAWGQNEFNSISGTSMASPHVSGAVLLLKEAFPFLSGADILLALYNTANDLGDFGEDNTYGMGIIDAYAAFNYLSTNNIPVPPNLINNDLVLLEINSIPNKISCVSTFTPTMTILNNTDSIIEYIQVNYKEYLNNTEEESIVYEVNLDPYSNTSLELPVIDNNNFGDKEFSFQINTINPLVESDYHNNRKMVRFKYKPTYNTPFTENFQNGISSDNWHINNNDYTRTWDTISTEGLNNNNIAAYVNLWGYNPRSEQKDELISPNFNLNGDSINMTFQLSYQKYNSSSKQDTLQIFLSTDCGQNYNYKIFEKGGQDLNTYNEQLIENFIPENDSHWREEFIDLTEFSDEEITLKFVTTNLRGNNIFIDNINIYDPENISLLNEDKLNITVHPNPSNRIFKLEFNSHYVKNINISNSIGQLIMPPQIIENNINQYRVDLENYNSGLYFITLQTMTGNKTVRILKK